MRVCALHVVIKRSETKQANQNHTPVYSHQRPGGREGVGETCDEHEDGVSSAAGVVREEAVPQRQHALALGYGSDGLHGAAVGQHPTGVGPLEGHPVLYW